MYRAGTRRHEDFHDAAPPRPRSRYSSLRPSQREPKPSPSHPSQLSSDRAVRTRDPVADTSAKNAALRRDRTPGSAPSLRRLCPMWVGGGKGHCGPGPAGRHAGPVRRAVGRRVVSVRSVARNVTNVWIGMGRGADWGGRRAARPAPLAGPPALCRLSPGALEGTGADAPEVNSGHRDCAAQPQLQQRRRPSLQLPDRRCITVGLRVRVRAAVSFWRDTIAERGFERARARVWCMVCVRACVRACLSVA